MTIPADAVSITVGSDGTVTVTQPGQTAATQVGSIQTALFVNPGGLNSRGRQHLPGDHRFRAAGHRQPRAAPKVWESLQQGMLEQSNVSVVNQFVAMILAQRSYESNSRVVKAADEMLQQLNQLAS